MKYILKFILLLTLNLTCISLIHAEAQVIGTYKGQLEIPNATLELFFHFSNEGNEAKLKLDIPAQNLIGYPADKVRIDEDKIQVTFQALNAQYIGTIASDTSLIEGTFIQNGFELPLKFEKISSTVESQVKRTQVPINNNDYLEEGITFTNAKAKIQLAGTLTLPKSHNKKTPIAILISGSGQQDRNSSIMGHEPFHVIADYLSRRGIGVLRYDDRGVGQSEGASLLSESTSADFAEDAAAALLYLRKKGYKNIGFIGHSEGGIIAPMVATAYPKQTKFIILLAAQGVSGDSIIVHQSYTGSRAEGVDEAVANYNRDFTRTITRFVKNYPGSNLTQDLATLLDATFQQKNPITETMNEEVKGSIKNRTISAFTVPWMKYFLNLDPQDYLPKVKCPILAIHGTHDVQIPYPENQQAMRNILEKSKHRNFVLLTGERLNHLLQTSNTGAVSEYINIEETIAPFVLESMYKWIEGMYTLN